MNCARRIQHTATGQKALAGAAGSPPAALAALGLIFWGQLRGLTAAELLNYLPASVPLAALSLIGLHGLKSLSLVFPLAVLQVAGGLLLPTGWAFAVNLAGMLVSLSLPYGVGRFTGNQLWRWLCARFPPDTGHRAV